MQHFRQDRISAKQESDQTAKIRRLIIVIAMRYIGSQIFKLSLDGR